MRIDLNYGPHSVPENERAHSQTSPASSANRSSLGEDQAQISGGHVQAQALSAQAMQLPEIRQQRIEALKQIVSSGQYHPQPQNTAGALLVHMGASNA